MSDFGLYKNVGQLYHLIDNKTFKKSPVSLLHKMGSDFVRIVEANKIISGSVLTSRPATPNSIEKAWCKKIGPAF